MVLTLGDMNYSGPTSISSARRRLQSSDGADSWHGVTAVAEMTGYYPVRIVEDEEFMQNLYQESSSLRMIDSLRRISAIKDDTNRVELEIQKHSQEVETKNITNPEVLGRRIEKVQVMIDHLESLIRNKESLISRLRHQYMGDSLAFKLEDQRYVKEVIECMAPTLTSLPVILENIDKVPHIRSGAGQRLMSESLSEVLSVMDSLNQILEQIVKLRTSMSRINSHYKPSTLST